MSDEIDIEEHDLMDNPSIKKIFPDLSVIKQEINHYYDEGTVVQDIKLEQPTPRIDCISYSETSGVNKKCNELLIDTKVNILTKVETQESKHLCGNIIILGSKPNNDCESNSIKHALKAEPEVESNKHCKTNISKHEQKREPKILINKIDSFLKECKRYCDECFILFPKPTFYRLHKINDHSAKTEDYDLSGLPKCLKCNKTFSCRFSLKRHRKSLHNNAEDNNTSDQKTILSSDSNIKSSEGNHCFHCQKLFPTQNSLIEHLYEVLAPKSVENCNGSSKKSENNAFVCKTDEEMPDSIEKMDNQLNKNKSQEIEIATKTTFTDEMKNDNKIYSGYSIKCDRCHEQFDSKNKLAYHNMTVHKYCRKINKDKSKKEKNSNRLNKLFGRLLYRCPFCSKYTLSLKFYSHHILLDHKIQVEAKAKKVPFNPQCSFCPSKLSCIKTYNAHLAKYHRKKIKEHIKTFDQEEHVEDNIICALKSVLFQCLECDTHFLSVQDAMNHSMHSTLDNDWECEICHRKFKPKDKVLHKDQHASDNIFIAYSLPKSALTMVLYKCFECAVHFSEDSFLEHNGNCDSKTPNSTYCRFCDILVNRVDMEFHKSYHEQSNVLNSDLTIIETDMLDTRSVSSSKQIKYIKINKRSQKKGYIIMEFCNTCNCFMNNARSAHKVHLEGKCSHLPNMVCKLCGLVFTTKSHEAHVRLHKKRQIKFQDYLFYDLKSKKQILPPVPDYPKCNLCGVHFSSKIDIRIHYCKTEYETCKICSIKLSDLAYKLHMAFHNYSYTNDITEQNNVDIERINDETAPLNSTNSDNAILKINNFIYTCKSCQVSVKTYDDVIKHCQDHYDCKEIQLTTQKCLKCGLLYIDDNCCCTINTTMKGKNVKVGTFNIANFTIIDFDPCYMRFDNTFWTRHIFAYISDEQITKILDSSMYRDECRLKMEELQPGSSDSILYKCGKCLIMIEAHCLYTHAENSRSSPCAKTGKYPCAHCGLFFSSWKHRATHVKEHGDNAINPKSCRIILFNKTEHDRFNQTMFDACNKYVLYQCRNCERVVDKFQRKDHKCSYSNLKMCMNCGLLFHAMDYDIHFIRHEELDKFNTDHMYVVLFGKNSGLSSRPFRSTFDKTRVDLTLYRCKNCELCVMSKKSIMTRHTCVLNETRCKCSKCGLYFLEKDLLQHCKLHDTFLDKFNVNIITYNVSTMVESTQVKLSTKAIMEVKNNLIEVADGKDFKEKNDFKTKTDSKVENDFKAVNDFKNKIICKDKNGSVVEENIINCKIYNCSCGLHFLEYENAKNHVDVCSIKMKISRQSCFKCDLLFTPGELFNHLLVHHCDKKLQYKFDIVTVHKSNEITDMS